MNEVRKLPRRNDQAKRVYQERTTTTSVVLTLASDKLERSKMKRHPIVAGRRRTQKTSIDSGPTKKTKTRSRYSVLTGVAIPTVAIVTAFFTTPAYDLWQDWKLDQEPPLKAEVRPGGINGSRATPVGYFFPRKLPGRQIETLRVGADQEAVALGAVPVGRTEDTIKGPDRGKNVFRVNLVGNRREKVQIREIRAHVLSCKPIPKDGTLFMWRPQGGSDVSRVAVDLDSSSKRAFSADRPFFDDKVRYVVEGEPLSFEVDASTASGWCSWEIKVDVSYGDQKETMTVREDGSATGPPFQTVAWPGDRNKGTLSNIYEVSVGTGETVNCTEAWRGIPTAAERANRGDVC